MARFLCGVMGDAWGHVHEVLALAEILKGHEFLIIGGGRAAELGRMGFSVVNVPMPSTLYAGNRVRPLSTAANALSTGLALPAAVRTVANVIREYKPHLILSLYEIVTPLAARRLGLPCLSLDHQHLLTHCRFDPLPGQRVAHAGLIFSMRLLFTWATRYLVHSFFPLTPRDPDQTEVFPPLLSSRVLEKTPTRGEHVVVYQTSDTFHRLLDALVELDRPCFVYGFGERPSRRNLSFRAFCRDGFLSDLASCAYLIANGSHTVLSEAFHLGKPVYSFPIDGAYEQYVNAFMLRKMGFGDCSDGQDLRPETFARFESRLVEYESRLAGGVFSGGDRLARRLVELVGC